jgi:hypothetical protein
MEKMDTIIILNKLLVARSLLEPKNDHQAVLMDKPRQIVGEVIEEVTKEVELRQQFESECG